MTLGCTLSACGGGGSSTPAATVATSVPPKPVSVDAEGDSTMLGLQRVNGVYVVTANSAPTDLQADLQESLGPTVTVENHGIGGTTVCQRVNGTAPYTQTLAQELSTDQSQNVIGNWLINDSSDQSTETPTQYQQCWEQFVTVVRAAGKTPLIEEPNPVVGSTFNPSDPTVYANFPNYLAIMRSVAQSLGVTLITQYDYIQTLPNWQEMLTDGVHPDDALYSIKAQRELSTLLPLVENLVH
jgi:acyl-CoA thioesterase-1